MAQTIALEGIISYSVFHFHGVGPIFRFHELRHPNVKHKTQISRGIFKIFSDTKAVGSYSMQKSFIFQTIST